MTQSITPRNGAADISAAVPTQRIVTAEALDQRANRRVRDRRGRFTSPDAQPERSVGAISGAGRSDSGRTEPEHAESSQAGRSGTGRSRSADRAERAARARAERAAARAKAESETVGRPAAERATGQRPTVERRTAERPSGGRASVRHPEAGPSGGAEPGHGDPMEDRAKRFRAAISDLTADRQGGPGHGGPLVRARAARSGTPADRAQPARTDVPSEIPARSRANRPAQGVDQSQRPLRPQRMRTPERPSAPERAQRPERAQSPRPEVRDEHWMTPGAMTPIAEEPMRLRSPLADLTFDRLERTTALPDLTAALGAIPGGLGAEVVESFVFAGQQWSSGDADSTGTPIGVQLAMEQRGLGVQDGRHPGASTVDVSGPGAAGLDGLETEHLDSRRLEGEPSGYGHAPGVGVGRRRAAV